MKHLKDANQTYFAHFKDAISYSGKAFKSSIYFLIHSIYPDFCQTKGGETIKNLHTEIELKKKDINKDFENELISQTFKLKDLVTFVKNNKINWNNFLIQPLEINYKIKKYKITTVYKHFEKTNLPLLTHLNLQNITDTCYIKIRECDTLFLNKDQDNTIDYYSSK